MESNSNPDMPGILKSQRIMSGKTLHPTRPSTQTAILRLSLGVNLSCLHNFNTVNTFDRNRDLLNASAKNLAEFLHTDLDVGLTFTERAKIKKQLGEMEAFERNKQKAARALESVRHFVERLSDAEAKAAIRSRCIELERAISALKTG